MRFPHLAPVVAAALVAAAAPACSKEPAAGLTLALSTDMAVPDDVTAITLDLVDARTNVPIPLLDSAGKTVLAIEGNIQDGRVAFPATINVGRADDYERESISIRLVAYKGDDAKVLRKVTTSLPSDAMRLLRLDLSYLDWGSGEGSLQAVNAASVRPLGANAVTAKLCPEGQTSEYGECVDGTVDASTLPVADGAPLAEACFDMQACFENRRVLLADGAGANLDVENCALTFLKDVPLDKVNFAVLRKKPPTSSSAQGALCKGGDCFVPLSRGERTPAGKIKGGAYAVDAATSTIYLGRGLCKVLTTKADLLGAVIAGFGCDAKTREIPVCASWSKSGLRKSAAGAVTVPGASFGAPVRAGDSTGAFAVVEGSAAGGPASEVLGLEGVTSPTFAGVALRNGVEAAKLRVAVGDKGQFAAVTGGALTLINVQKKEALTLSGANTLADTVDATVTDDVAGEALVIATEADEPPAQRLFRVTENSSSSIKPLGDPLVGCTALARDGATGYVACAGPAAAGPVQSTIYAVDGSAATRLLTVDGYVRAMVVDHPGVAANDLYILSQQGVTAALARLPLGGGPVAPLTTFTPVAPITLKDFISQPPLRLAVDGEYVYVANSRDGAMVMVLKGGGAPIPVPKAAVVGDFLLRPSGLYVRTGTVVSFLPRCSVAPAACKG